MRFTLVMAATCSILLGFCCSASAGIVGTSGQMVAIPTPPDARFDVLESNTFIYVFPERQDVTLVSDLLVDISIPGTVPIGSVNLSPGLIPSGTRVSSYLIHFDPVGIPSQPVSPDRFSSGVTFNSPVLGIQVLSSTLYTADGVLGALSTLYPVGEPLRGLELAIGMIGVNTFDGINLSADLSTVFVILSAQLSLDQVRIITAVPEPSSLALCSLGGVGLLGLVRERRRKMPRPSMTAALMIALLCVAAAASTARADFTYAHTGDADPETQGFTGVHVFGAPSNFGPIANDLGYPAWSVSGTGQSSQYVYVSGPLSDSELDDIAVQGFTLTMTARVVQGLAPLYSPDQPVAMGGVIFNTGIQRFDVGLGLDTNGDTVVFLPTSIGATGPGASLEGPGPSYTLVGSGSSYHTYSLVYDPASQLADLFVDGILRIEGYAGNTSFIANGGLMFGGASGGQANFSFVQVASVPEPSSIALAGIAIVLTAVRGSRRHVGEYVVATRATSRILRRNSMLCFRRHQAILSVTVRGKRRI